MIALKYILSVYFKGNTLLNEIVGCRTILKNSHMDARSWGIPNASWVIPKQKTLIVDYMLVKLSNY